MTYTQYSQNKYSGVYYYYKCSKCGTVNQGMVLIGASASYNDKGILFSKKALHQIQNGCLTEIM